MNTLAFLLCTAAGLGMAWQGAAAWAVRRFMRKKPFHQPAPEPVTLLKPLCGAEPDLLDNLRSWWRQPWPDLRMVCGVRDPDDPAVAVVRRLQAEFPDGDIRLVIGGPARAANAKIANLMNMMAAARPGILVLADSDMRAAPDTLPALVATLAEPGMGAVTCLYAATPAPDTASRLGALGINAGFLPAALLARSLGRRDGCFGATIALRHSVLEGVGGFAALADHLADDYALGERIRDTGLEVALAPVLVEARPHESGWRGLIAHEIRANRTIATLAPWGYAGSVLTQPVALALLGWAAGGPGALVVLALLVRLAAVAAIGRAIGMPLPLWLVPLRDGLTLVLFPTALGRSVQWRGRRYRLRRGGLLEALP